MSKLFLNICLFLGILFLKPSIGQVDSSYTFIDSLYEYKIDVPGWLIYNPEVDDNVFGGYFFSTDQTKNEIFIYSFYKSDFESFTAFTDKFISKNIYGEESLFNSNWICQGKEQIINRNGQISCKMYFTINNELRHFKFVLRESENFYYWIYFNATPSTYSESIEKFNLFTKKITPLKLK